MRALRAAWGREVTHFYQLDQPITERPWRAMFLRYPLLAQARDNAHLAFLAGYVAHLALDEFWAENMVRPHFWGTRTGIVSHWRDKLFALHLILTVMDERDQAELHAWQADSLAQCQPQDWLPFLGDDILRDWRDFVSGQIAPRRPKPDPAHFQSAAGLRCRDCARRAG